MGIIISECFQLIGNPPEFTETVRGLSSIKGKSRLNLTAAIGGMPSGPW